MFSASGLLWRTVVFLAGLVLLSWIFSLQSPSCSNFNNQRQDNNQQRENPATPVNSRDTVHLRDTVWEKLPPELRDTSLVRDWNDSIPGVRELPDPRDNFIPPVDSTRIIQDPENPYNQMVSDQLIVLFNSKDLKADIASFARQFKQHYPGNDYQILYYNPQAGTMLLGVPQDQVLVLLDELTRVNTGIYFKVTNNDIMKEAAVPQDPGFQQAAYRKYFNLIQAFDAWEITKGTPEVKVAIVDSYFDLTNPEIGERYVDRIHIPSKTLNVLPPWTPPTASNFTSYCHGSHVAGIAIGGQNNQLGVSGIAPECTWIPIALGSELTSFNIIEALMYAVYHDADVVNLSIGRGYPEGIETLPFGDQVTIAKETCLRGEELWEYVWKIADEHNCVICTAAGNESILMGMDPKNRSQKIIKVEAVDAEGKRAPFSNFGTVSQDFSYSTVSAPGVNLWSVSNSRCAPFWWINDVKTSPSGDFQEMSGTSMASPVVAGAVALLKSKNKELTPENIIKILRMTGKQTDTSGQIGPTIQIKDALDATANGDRLNFDDLLADHDLLIGKWRSTKELNLLDGDGNFKEEIWMYFIFPSTSRGTLEIHTITSGRTYTAPLRVKWTSKTIDITQTADAEDPTGDRINKDDFVCYPNSERLLEVSCRRGGTERFRFMLEKVN